MSLAAGASGWLAYAFVFGTLVICGLGLPFPEDITLILGGYLVHMGQAKLGWMMLCGYVGILGGDSVMFLLGQRVGARLVTEEKGFWSRIVTREKRLQVQRLFQTHGEKVVMIARFLPGVRAVTYFTAGAVGMRYSHFAFFDSVAALASAPFFVYLGYAFGGSLDWLLEELKRGQRNVILGLLVVALVGGAVWWWRRQRRQTPPPPPEAPAGVPPADKSGTVPPPGTPGPVAP